MTRKKDNSTILENRKAHFEYFLSDFLVAGIALTGTEIKSLRAHNAGITDAYVVVRNGEAWLANMHIAAYKEGNIFNVDHLRDRKLLLKKKEILKLGQTLKGGGRHLRAHQGVSRPWLCQGRNRHRERQTASRQARFH